MATRARLVSIRETLGLIISLVSWLIYIYATSSLSCTALNHLSDVHTTWTCPNQPTRRCQLPQDRLQSFIPFPPMIRTEKGFKKNAPREKAEFITMKRRPRRSISKRRYSPASYCLHRYIIYQLAFLLLLIRVINCGGKLKESFGHLRRVAPILIVHGWEDGENHPIGFNIAIIRLYCAEFIFENVSNSNWERERITSSAFMFRGLLQNFKPNIRHFFFSSFQKCWNYWICYIRAKSCCFLLFFFELR